MEKSILKTIYFIVLFNNNLDLLYLLHVLLHRWREWNKMNKWETDIITDVVINKFWMRANAMSLIIS